jgi:hypothetical protein
MSARLALTALLLLGSLQAQAEWFGAAETALTFDDNVSRAQRESDIRSDTSLLLRATGGYHHQLDGKTGVSLSLRAEREWFFRYEDLSAVRAGPMVAVRTKLGTGAQAPWLRLSTSALRLEHDDDLRTGWLFEIAAAGGARLTERLGLHAEARLEKRRADDSEPVSRRISGAVFDIDGWSASVGGDYALSRATLVSFSYSYRKGDVVSSTRRNAAIFAASDAIARDPAFGPDVIAYRLHARSHVLDLGVSHALSERTSINVALGRSFTYGEGGNDYYGNRASVSLLFDF